MIQAKEVKKISIDQGIPLPYVEKDYVMGWLLWGIYNNPTLSKNLILKGGNCLRKIYFPDTRFSDDLDFTAKILNAEEDFKNQLQAICEHVKNISGIPFDLNRTSVKEVTIPLDKNKQGEGVKVFDGRVYFKGFAGDSSLTMRIKFDISQYERIVLPLQHHPMFHHYSDASLCNVNVFSYSLEEVLAEKLRSWVQRTRARDLFDIVKIISSRAIPISKTNILSAFFQKTIFKDIPFAGHDELLFDNKFESAGKHWIKTIICSANARIIFSNAITLFKDFVNVLFQPETLEAIGISPSNLKQYSYEISSNMRETIIEAGKSRQLIKMNYHDKDRDIEPYSFRYKIDKNGYGAEFFYGFDRTRGNHIKMYRLDKIQGGSISTAQYEPRWVVEFSH